MIDKVREQIERGSKNLNFYNQQIGDQGVEYISQQASEDIDTLELGGVGMTVKGILSMSKVGWDKLTALSFCSRLEARIGNQGSRYLSRIDFPLLSLFFLNQSQICGAGVIHLSKAKWPSLITLSMKNNHIYHQMRELVKNDWKKLERMVLKVNDPPNNQSQLHESHVSVLRLSSQRSLRVDLNANRLLVPKADDRIILFPFTMIPEVIQENDSDSSE